MITGDLNFHIDDPRDTDAQKFLQIISEHGCLQLDPVLILFFQFLLDPEFLMLLFQASFVSVCRLLFDPVRLLLY